MEPNPRDYYAVLGIPQTATLQGIRRSYRQLVLQTHPDKNPHDKDATRKFQILSEAYETLRDVSKRATYDRDYQPSRCPGDNQNRGSYNPQTKQENGGGWVPDWNRTAAFWRDQINLRTTELDKHRQARDKIQRDQEQLKLEIHKVAKSIRGLNEENRGDDEAEKAANSWSAWLLASSDSAEAKEGRKRRRAERKTGLLVLEAKRASLLARLNKLMKELEDIKGRIITTEGDLLNATIIFRMKDAEERQRAEKEREEKQRAERERAERERQERERHERERREQERQRAEKERQEKQRAERERAGRERQERERRERERREQERQKQQREQREREQREGERAAQRRREEAEEARRAEELRRQLREKNEHKNEPCQMPKPTEARPDQGTEKQAGPRNPGPGARPNTGAARAGHRGCQHGGSWWPKIDGRHRCARCQIVTKNFALQCRVCHTTACANCKREMKNDREMSARFD